MKKLIMASITAVVVIVVLAGTLIPILDDATATQDVLSNRADAMYPIEKITPDMDYKLVWDTSTPGYVTINDTEQVSIMPGSIVCSVDSFVLRCGMEGTKYFLQSVGESLSVYVSVAYKPGVLTIENNSGTLTVTSDFTNDTDVTKTVTFTEMYSVYPDGSYVMKSSSQKAYMKADSEIFALGLTTLDGVWNNAIQIEGTIEGVTISQVYPDPATYTFSNTSINYAESNDYVDAYLLDTITFDATNISTENVTACTYSYFVVPAEITAERAVHFTDGENAIFNAIPAIVIIALLLGVVAIVLRSRMD